MFRKILGNPFTMFAILLAVAGPLAYYTAPGPKCEDLRYATVNGVEYPIRVLWHNEVVLYGNQKQCDGVERPAFFIFKNKKATVAFSGEVVKEGELVVGEQYVQHRDWQYRRPTSDEVALWRTSFRNEGL